MSSSKQHNKSILFSEATLCLASSALEKRNIHVGDKKTSVRLEPLFWKELNNIAVQEKVALVDVCQVIDTRKDENSSLSSAIRVFVLSYMGARLSQVTEETQGNMIGG